MTMKRKVRVGDLSHGPFNVPFTEAERQVLREIDEVRERVERIKANLRQLPKHACAPPKNYDPDQMAMFKDIRTALDDLEAHLRWIPGGAYRFAEDEKTS